MCCGYKKQTKVIRYEINLGSCGVDGGKNTNLPTFIPFYNCFKIIVLIMILNFQNVLKYINYGNLLCISFKIK